jgi:GNAT superfamily N-acetyltransferase
MAQENLIRMIQLADEVFGMRQDPAQISVNARVIKRLEKIHPCTLTAKNTRKGPIAWMLVIPTTHNLMKQFIAKKITEKDLFKKTPLWVKYEAVYLCSALVLPEHRRKGLAKRLIIKAMKAIQRQHPIHYLFYWAFSKGGTRLAESVAKELSLPLYKRLR